METPDLRSSAVQSLSGGRESVRAIIMPTPGTG